MAEKKQAKQTVDWTNEQIERAEDVLRVVIGLIDEERGKLDRANTDEAFMIAVLDTARLQVQTAINDLMSAYVQTPSPKNVSKRTVETVQRFRSLGPPRLKRRLAWKEVERAYPEEVRAILGPVARSRGES